MRRFVLMATCSLLLFGSTVADKPAPNADKPLPSANKPLLGGDEVTRIAVEESLADDDLPPKQAKLLAELRRDQREQLFRDYQYRIRQRRREALELRRRRAIADRASGKWSGRPLSVSAAYLSSRQFGRVTYLPTTYLQADRYRVQPPSPNEPEQRQTVAFRRSGSSRIPGTRPCPND